MIRTKKRLAVCLSLTAFNILFIWVNSMLPSEVSAGFSRLVGRIIDFLIPGSGDTNAGQGHGILRKIAHLMEFLCLGVLLSWLVRMLRQKTWEYYAFPLLAGVAVASVDETIQCFVPGRGPGILDVCIDSTGVILGILLLSCIIHITNRKK